MQQDDALPLLVEAVTWHGLGKSNDMVDQDSCTDRTISCPVEVGTTAKQARPRSCKERRNCSTSFAERRNVTRRADKRTLAEKL